MQIKIEFESGFGKFADKYTVRRFWGNSVEEPGEFYMQSHTLYRIGDADVYTANEANIDVTHHPFVDAIIALANVSLPTHENYPDHGKIILAEHSAKQAVKSAITHPAPAIVEQPSVDESNATVSISEARRLIQGHPFIIKDVSGYNTFGYRFGLFRSETVTEPFLDVYAVGEPLAISHDRFEPNTLNKRCDNGAWRPVFSLRDIQAVCK